jgi:hypothetical protein
MIYSDCTPMLSKNQSMDFGKLAANPLDLAQSASSRQASLADRNLNTWQCRDPIRPWNQQPVPTQQVQVFSNKNQQK